MQAEDLFFRSGTLAFAIKSYAAQGCDLPSSRKNSTAAAPRDPSAVLKLRQPRILVPGVVHSYAGNYFAWSALPACSGFLLCISCRGLSLFNFPQIASLQRAHGLAALSFLLNDLHVECHLCNGLRSVLRTLFPRSPPSGYGLGGCESRSFGSASVLSKYLPARYCTSVDD